MTAVFSKVSSCDKYTCDVMLHSLTVVIIVFPSSRREERSFGGIVNLL